MAQKTCNAQTGLQFDTDEKFQLDKTQADTNSLHGDGLFPIRDARGILIPWNGQVIAASPASMQVKVKDFVALIKDVDGGAFIVGDRHLTNTVVKTLTVTTAHATLKRHDLVTVAIPVDAKGQRINEKDWSKLSIAVLKGTAAATPVDPTVPDNTIVLYRVIVRAGATSILSTDLVDIREWLKDVDDLSVEIEVLKNSPTVPVDLVNRVTELETDVVALQAAPGGVVAPDVKSHTVLTTDVDEPASDYSLNSANGAFQIPIQTTTPQPATFEDTFTLPDESPLDPAKWTYNYGAKVINGRARIEGAESFYKYFQPWSGGSTPPDLIEEFDIEYDLILSAELGYRGGEIPWNTLQLGNDWFDPAIGARPQYFGVGANGFALFDHYMSGEAAGSASWQGPIVYDGVTPVHVKISRRKNPDVAGEWFWSMTVSGAGIGATQTISFTTSTVAAGKRVLSIGFQQNSYWGNGYQYQDIDNVIYRPVTDATYAYKAAGMVQTEPLPGVADISQIQLDATVEKPAGTNATFDVSLDSGSHWITGVALNTPINVLGAPFNGLGDVPKVRVNMTGPGGTGDVTPRVSNIRIVTSGVMNYANFREKYNGLIDVAIAAVDGNAFRVAVAALPKYSV